ncbi:hypothetical protein RHMOL_Rhmol01G0211400 [Rhododendron molle]|uniref:Uncharacterized protein n=1 Tax=Rhododendron molle TaxID=49168 RepID=A0ACC0Q4D9_RHOML|nr:hypothetical protein RHMOL_Rhmol01G0211400 [Rhododendron molle]
MAENSILGSFYLNLLRILVFTYLRTQCSSYEVENGGPYNSFTVSSFSYSKTQLKPFEWRYIRVDLPPWFSSISVALESDVELNPDSIKDVPTSRLPMICLREGSPPLPDAYNSSLTGLVFNPLSNGSFGDIQGFQNAELCYPMQKNVSLKLTNEQINRGPAYSFRGNVRVEGCKSPLLYGQYCNQTVDPLSCVYTYNVTENQRWKDPTLYSQTAENVVSCINSNLNFCHGIREPKIYYLDVLGISEQLTIMASNVRFIESGSSNGAAENGTGIILMCYARHGTLPLANSHDVSANISEAPLVIRSPKVGRWYIGIHLVGMSTKIGGLNDLNGNVCYSLDLQVLQCPEEKAGLNCKWEKYLLQTVLRKNPSIPFESYYIPISSRVSSNLANFPLEPLLSNSSCEGTLNVTWTYFLLDIPDGAAGGNLHIRLNSDAKINYEIYARYGGLPSFDSWDYFYANTKSSSNGSIFFKLYDSDDKMVSFYILYVRGGTWGFGLRRLNVNDSASKIQTTMSISLERCPRRCSSHGTCQSVLDASGLTLYSYCSCDRDHGGVDCSVEIVSHQGHIWQSISLIASNAAAVLPAYWCLRQKAFAEWVLFMSSGISSGLYHACDVGTWCPLSFRVLQFMDFWLSFMAVVSTFVYLADISEASRRTIHTVVAIITALMAETGPTRSTNIALVIAIGALGLLIAWLIEFCTKFRSLSFSMELRLNIHDRWQAVKTWLRNLIKMLLKRFRWGFVLAGFTVLAMAAISWTLESTENYWVWHSLWHVSIYTSSFLFLCSKAITLDGETQQPLDGNYALTRQDLFSRPGIER